jgi:hypothetical protein
MTERIPPLHLICIEPNDFCIQSGLYTMESKLWELCLYRKVDQIPSKPIILGIFLVFGLF